MVDYWADRGVTSFKAYMNITRAELKAAIEAAHKRGIKVTGHLCSVTYKEAAELGIDDLEHGFFVNTQLDPEKKPDLCSESMGAYTLEHMPANGPEAKDLIDTLVKHHVAITSTLPVFESGSIPGRPPLRQQTLDVMTPEAREAYLYNRERPATMKPPKDDWAMLFKRDMELEHAFAQAGGLLLAGPDPTGNGGVVPGFGDQREIELLVEAGFSPVEAIKIATLNGATYLGKQDQIGTSCRRKKRRPRGDQRRPGKPYLRYRECRDRLQRRRRLRLAEAHRFRKGPLRAILVFTRILLIGSAPQCCGLAVASRAGGGGGGAWPHRFRSSPAALSEGHRS